MPSISDLALSTGCTVAVESIHSEVITILTGADAGKTFVGVRENEQDIIFQAQLDDDPRGHRIIRFRLDNPQGIPKVNPDDKVQTDDGKMWNLLRRPDSAYLTVDFELSEVVQGKDTPV